MKSGKLTTLAGACLLMSPLMFAQDQPAPSASPAPAAAPAAPASVWSVGPIDFSGLIDGYYTYNANHPQTSPGVPGQNGYYNFNMNANQMSLSMAKLTMSHDADPVGFRFDLGFGKAFDIIHAAEPAGSNSFLRNIEQAYVTVKSKKGYALDFGQFVTSAGAEVIEAKDNWNYSRSLLFAWAIPYYHFGLRSTLPVGTHFTGGVQLVNGWNNLEDNNSGKTLGFVGNFTGKKVSWNNNYYTGPENTGTNKGFRNLIDTTLLLTPADKFNAYVNFDYGHNSFATGPAAEWKGIAGAAKFQLNSKFAITPRMEWFDDTNGYETGTAQTLKEITVTAEYKAAQGILGRLEYRYDWSDKPFSFQRGVAGTNDHQNTITVGIIAYFGPKH
jgi:hypothetical protein